MQVWGIELDYARKVAADLDIRLDSVRNGPRNSFFAVLRPATPNRWRRTSSSAFSRGRRVNAVCYHGHYAWMNALFSRNMDARIKSSMADYRGREDFLDKAEDEAGYRDIGPMVAPLYHMDACLCDEDAMEDALHYVYSG